MNGVCKAEAKRWRNVWCILRSLDRFEIKTDHPDFDWFTFRQEPHEYFARNFDSPIGRAIWDAVENRSVR